MRVKWSLVLLTKVLLQGSSNNWGTCPDGWELVVDLRKHSELVQTLVWNIISRIIMLPMRVILWLFLFITLYPHLLPVHVTFRLMSKLLPLRIPQPPAPLLVHTGGCQAWLTGVTTTVSIILSTALHHIVPVFDQAFSSWKIHNIFTVTLL